MVLRVFFLGGPLDWILLGRFAPPGAHTSDPYWVVDRLLIVQKFDVFSLTRFT